MKAPTGSRRLMRIPHDSYGIRITLLASVLALAAVGVAGAARAQQSPLRALSDKLNWTAEAGDGPDFVTQSRPDPKTMGYSPLTGEEKKRVPVKTPDQVKADMDQLVKVRGLADAKAKGLNAVKADPVAPNKVAPIKDE
jgi:alkanesulfonate monooxygenase SsuD/methylene tetrahydromethanopterin reductase-like flavin-dependent oxidoreductase (luciferase family)